MLTRTVCLTDTASLLSRYLRVTVLLTPRITAFVGAVGIVVSKRTKPQMTGINTSRIITNVAHHQTAGVVSVVQEVHYPRGNIKKPFPIRLNAELPVPVVIFASEPLPTRVIFAPPHL